MEKSWLHDQILDSRLFIKIAKGNKTLIVYYKLKKLRDDLSIPLCECEGCVCGLSKCLGEMNLLNKTKTIQFLVRLIESLLTLENLQVWLLTQNVLMRNMPIGYSGASNHICANPTLFQNLIALPTATIVHLPDANMKKVMKVGDIKLNNLILKNILYLPTFKHILLSVSYKLTKTNSRN